MSSQQPFSPLPLVGEVHHIHHLSDQIGQLYISDEYSDVVLVVEKTRISAHKVKVPNQLISSP
jgi:BTB/POZ domain-containing protein 9